MTLLDATTFQSESDHPLIQTTNQDRPWDVENNPERRTNEENDKDLVCQEQTFERLLPVGVVHGVECRVYPTTSANLVIIVTWSCFHRTERTLGANHFLGIGI